MNSSHVFSAHSNDFGQFVYDEIDTLQSRFLQSGDLFFHDSFKCHVRCEQTNSDAYKQEQLLSVIIHANKTYILICIIHTPLVSN